MNKLQQLIKYLESKGETELLDFVQQLYTTSKGMRRRQKAYFASKTTANLDEAKKVEAYFDRLLEEEASLF